MPVTNALYESFPRYPFCLPRDLQARQPLAPVVIVGAGPVGLTLACALARYGVRSVVLEARDSASFGSRAICISRRSLEIWARFGLARRPLAKGLPWAGGRSYWHRHEVLHFEMPHDITAQHPPMLNIQQCFVEQYLIDAALESGLVDLRWHSRVNTVTQRPDRVSLTVDTPAGVYALDAAHVVACDGARSTVRDALGLRLEGNSYEGRYLIADIVLRQDWPVERLAWFDPPSNPRSTVLAHRQPDNVLRVDYQLREDEDPDLEQQEARVRSRIDAHLQMLGRPPAYDLIWISLYRAHCLSLPRYREGRVLFAGDAAHLVPIFGVRGLNSGIDDAANLAWKLALVIDQRGDEALLDSYSHERVYAAHENIRQARKSTLFMSPPSRGYALMRDAALSLAVSQPFARALVNPRQSTAIAYPDSPLQTPDADRWPAAPVPGAVLPNPRVARRAADGSLRDAHLLDLCDLRPTLILRSDFPLTIGTPDADLQQLRVVPVQQGGEAEGSVVDQHGEVAAALALDAPAVAWLVRPDGHIAARWRHLTPGVLGPALRRLAGHCA